MMRQGVATGRLIVPIAATRKCASNVRAEILAKLCICLHPKYVERWIDSRTSLIQNTRETFKMAPVPQRVS